MAIKTQWKSVGIFTCCLLVFIILLYELFSKNSLPASASQTAQELLDKEKEIAREYKRRLDNKEDVGKPCCRRDENNLLGQLLINRQPPESLTALEKKLPFVKLGGQWEPASCSSPVKVAIIVPYRNRHNNLLVFLRHIHPFLNRQRLYYQLFVVEQSEKNAFNKGKLQNIGFQEALKYDSFDCFVFHDVDLLPEDDRNYYGCPTSPQHLSPSLDKFDYKIHSVDVFGGVAAFTKNDFNEVNGYSNSFYGVEGENQDMIGRIHTHKKRIHRPVLRVGRYSMLQHKKRLQNREKGHPEQRDKLSHEAVDGLKRLRYKVLHNEKYNLFTLIQVDLLWDKNEGEAF